MSTKDTQDSPSSPQTLPPLSGGLFLFGVVIAVKTEEREWEKQKYTQTTVSITDGQQVFLMKHRHDDTSWVSPQLFTQVKVRVIRASTDKGQITVSGSIQSN